MSQDLGTPGRQDPRKVLAVRGTGENDDIKFELIREDASLEARRAGFNLLIQLGARPASSDKRQLYYDIIITPVDVSLVELQIRALHSLTQGGRDLVPFETEIVSFLNAVLSKSYDAAEQARTGAWGIRSDTYILRDTTSAAPLREPVGAEKAMLDTIYLITNILSQHPSAAQNSHLAALVKTVANMTETTVTHRALRGSLKIFAAITEQSQLPEQILEVSVGSLCAVAGSVHTKYSEDAWTCLLNLLRGSDRSRVFDLINMYLSSSPSIKDVRKLLRYRGALICIRRILADSDLTQLFTWKSRLLSSNLIEAYKISPYMALETLRTIDVLLCNAPFMYLFIQGSWEPIEECLTQLDHFSRSHLTSSDRLGRRDTDTGAALRFYLPRHAQYGAKSSPDIEACAIIEHIAGRIASILASSSRALSESQALTAVRILFYLAPDAPSIWEPAINEVWKQGLLKPDTDRWDLHLGELCSITSFIDSRYSSALCAVIYNFEKVFALVRDDRTRLQTYGRQLRHLFENNSPETFLTSPAIMAVASLTSKIGPSIDIDIFNLLLVVLAQSSKLTINNPDNELPVDLIVCECLIALFLKCFQQSHSKTLKVYEAMIKPIMASSSNAAKICVMRLLTRIRCNKDFTLRLVELPALEVMGANLCTTQMIRSATEASHPVTCQGKMDGLPDAYRIGRTSGVETRPETRSRSTTRSLNARDKARLFFLPSWMYDNGSLHLHDLENSASSRVLYVRSPRGENTDILDMGVWLDFMTKILSNGAHWDLYSYVLVHLPLQLSNPSLFSNQVKTLQILHSTIVIQLNSGDFQEPPADAGIKKGDVALCLYQILVMLLPYHESFSRRMTEDTVRTFRLGMEKWDRTGKCCIHALALCCYELPSYIEKQVVGITEMMQKRISQPELAMDILEFLGCLARIQEAYGKADIDFYRKIFGVCIRYLQYAWDQQRNPSVENASTRGHSSTNRQSGSSADFARTVNGHDTHGISAYVYTLAYQTIIFWFLSIDVSERAQHVGWLTQELTWKDQLGVEHIEEQSLVILDMMHRTAFSNLGETKPGSRFVDPENMVKKNMWLVGMSIITIEIAINADDGQADCGQLTKRQASGTTHATYHHNTAELPSHHVQEEVRSSRLRHHNALDVYPNHMFLQLTSTIAPTPIPLQPIPLPDDDFTRRAIKVFDTTDTVDGHKAGVIYVGEGQTAEAHILANRLGDDAFEIFLSGLGTKVALKNANFNTQGLDHLSDEDGTHTYAWRDRVTEIIYHVPTMMPTDLEDDPQCDRKKRHVGNDHIKIIFNASGRPYDLKTFTTAMNTIHIVITPEAQDTGVHRLKADGGRKRPANRINHPSYFCVQTFSSPDYPSISIAPDAKVVSADTLPAFVRQMAINASVFCQVWENRDTEYTSSWRARLQEILRLRKKYANTNTSANVHYPMPATKTTMQYTEGDTWVGKVSTGGIADADQLLNSLDFTRWT